ncbi:MAG: hypothetical protein P8J15_02975 [Candidatus Thioglobus sp.]|jgi:thiol:disulfide interchange protein|nr:hypothetical protein [Rhodobacterales bacterium]MDG1869506.1 hypothetical protein [Candidatus Thioglobus sp.]|tara:strand:- start:438 stop:821 length:384 start_codon:yes stop_codon:yes gene_type:complete
MTLSLVFRIQAVMFAIFGFMMLIMPGAMMSSFMPDVGENAVAESIMQGMSLMVLAMSYISWQMPNWAADNIKTVGMFFAIVHVAWIVLTIFQMTSGAFPSDTANLVGNIGPDVVLAILFFWKSRADA